MSALAADAPPTDATSARAPHLGWVVAGLSAAAGAIHFAMVPGHAGGSLVDPVGFAVVGWFQVLVAAAILSDRAGKGVYRAAVVGNLVVLGLWVWSRTAGLPVGSHAGEAEDASFVDGTSALLEVALVLVAARILLAPGEERLARGRLTPVLAGVAALALATTAITSDDAAGHGGAGHAHGDPAAHAAGADHHATEGDGHAALMAEIDSTRCDTELNIPAYWQEAEALGVDTYQGGAMATTSADHHGGTAAPTTTAPDPTGGRGSADLDLLVTLTGQSAGGEGAAAALVSTLAEVDQETYDAWLWWMRSSGTAGGGHAHDASAPGDSGGHGGHAGPQPWTALTDQAECDRLAEEIALARDTALKYPTAADAERAGWVRVTTYVPGIAAHYMNFDHVDGEFEITEPEMLLYDGNDDDAHIVGLSYYLVHEGDAEPTQGFTGGNDHYHRHVGLCVGAGGVIGDSTTTEEQCAAMGGRKATSDDKWMSHAWVVPGCESPWGVFSAASPLLDSQLDDESGDNDGHCSASAGRDRYGLASGPTATPTRAGG